VAALSQSDNNQPDNPFDVLGIPRAFNLDENAIETKYFELSKQWHPDRFAASGDKDLQIKSEEMSARLNKAYTALRTRENRLNALLEIVGGEGGNAKKNVIPLDLAEEYFEIQELADNDHSKAVAKAEPFRQDIEKKIESINHDIYQLASATDWMKPDRTTINAILEKKQELAYLISLIQNLERLRLDSGGAA